MRPGSKPGPMSRLWREGRSVERELVELELLQSHADEGQDFKDKLVSGFRITKVILHIYVRC